MSWIVVRPPSSPFEVANYYCEPKIRAKTPDDKIRNAYKFYNVITSRFMVTIYTNGQQEMTIDCGKEDRPFDEFDFSHYKEIKLPGSKVRRLMITSIFEYGRVI